MKLNNTVLLLLTLLLFSCVSSKEATKQEMTHEFIISYPGLSKQVIFDKTLKWIANNFRSAKQVIEYQDKETGSIIGNGATSLKAQGALLASQLDFTMNIDIKDGKARYRFINLYTTIYNTRNPLPETQAWHKAADIKFQSFIESLKEYINKNDEF